MESSGASDLKRICIVGAGAMGLVAIKYLNEHEGLAGTVFEQMDRVSGLWHYVEDTEKDANGLPTQSGIYANMRVNLPKELTQFMDFPFPDYEESVSYVGHQNVDKYLNAYADRFNLRNHIQLNTKVLNIRPISVTQSSGDLTTKWRVQVFNHNKNLKEEHSFDGVIIANGKFSEPVLPEIRGMDDFTGKVLHTKFYRRPEPESFRDQNVVFLGFGLSALDIGIEIADFTKTVTILNRQPFEALSKKLTIINSSIAYLKPKSVVLQNGDELPCDTLILSTGYENSFPILHNDCGITVQDGKYLGLYRHLHCPKHPTLCFPNLFTFAFAWRVPEIQAHYLAKFFQGHVYVPPENERRKEIELREAEWNEQKVPLRHRLKISKDVYPYLVALDQAAGGTWEKTRNLTLIYSCLMVSVARLFRHPDIFRKDRLTWLDSQTATYYCYADPDAGDMAELLTLEMNDPTGEVHITSSLGEIINKPFS